MMLEKVIQNISTAQGKQKQMYDRKHARPCEFQVRKYIPVYGVEAAKRDLAHIINFCYKNASRLNRYNFTTVNAIDFHFQHFILHHFCLVKYILGFCISFLPALRRPIPLGIQTRHIFLQEISIYFKFGLYVEGFCTY